MDIPDFAQIAGWGAVALSLGFAYIPKLNAWYDSKDSQTKQLLMAGILLAIVLVMFGLSALGLEQFYTIDLKGVYAALTTWVGSIIVSAGVYGGSKYIGSRGASGYGEEPPVR